jgi:predicted kinase
MPPSSFQPSPEIIVMVGVPSSGKSTWVTQHIEAHHEKDYVVISSDPELYNIGLEHGLTDEEGRVRYMDAYLQYHEEARRRAQNKLNEALAEGRNIILDRPHLAKRYRAHYLSQVPNYYKKIAVVMDTPLEIILKRWAVDIKGVPNFDLKKRIEEFEPVVKEEGFYSILHLAPDAKSKAGIVKFSKEHTKFSRGNAAKEHPEWYDIHIFDELRKKQQTK